MLRSSFFAYLASLVLLLASFVSADVEVLTPQAGSSYQSGSSVTVTWDDDGASPDLNTFVVLKILLCSGPNLAIVCMDQPLVTLTTASDITGGKQSVVIPADAGTDGEWFFQVYAALKTGKATWHYSERFALSGMTGTTIEATAGDDTTPPVAGGNVGGDSASGINSASFSVTYTLQTGPTKFGPMQSQPGTKVTASTASRRYPTSAVTYYTTPRNTLNAVSTITPGWDYTVESATNYATPAPDPSSLGYYAASQKMSSRRASAASARLRRRWVE